MQHRSPPSSWFITIPLVAGLTVMGLAGGQPVRSAPVDSEALDIIDRALERTAWADEHGFETRYRRAMSQWVRLHDDQGNVTDDETRGYEVEPYRGALFHKLTTRNGQPLKRLDRVEQEKRWQKFQAEADDPRRRERRVEDEDDNEIKFNEELVGRYTTTLEGVRELRGRSSYVLSFEPRSGRLPVRRRIDHALNKSRGEIWIDQETHENRPGQLPDDGARPSLVGHPRNYLQRHRAPRARTRGRGRLAEHRAGPLLSHAGAVPDDAPQPDHAVERVRARGVIALSDEDPPGSG